MKCIKCKNTEFTESNVRFHPEIKGEIVEVIVPTFICTKCEHSTMNSAQMNELRKVTADEYRRKHKLLTSDDIRKFREAFGMSQSNFASYLKVGEASIKRWETYFIQDIVQDEHIRLKCDETYAEINALEVSWKTHSPDIYNGYKSFNWILFKNLALFLLPLTKSPLFLNKAMYYADFLHFKNHNISITGTPYAVLEFGPCPDNFRALYEKLLMQNDIAQSTTHTHELIANKAPDMDLFDDREKQTIEALRSYISKKDCKYLYDLSHKEQGYINTPSFQVISYDYAKSLLISSIE